MNMDALEFLRERNRMCRRFDKSCDGCPAYENGWYCDSDAWDERLVATVEQWSKANPETDISKCRCCGYENIEEARQNFEKQLARGERSADEAKAYTIRKENAVPFTVDEPADDEWLKKHAEDVEKVMRSNVFMGRLYAAIDEKAAVFRETVEDRILCEWQLKRADVEDALRERDAYRATGLTPEGVKKLKEEQLDTRGAMLLGRLMAVELKHVNRKRLKELIEADKDGRVVVLPCKVGDMVYFRTYDCNGTVDLGIQPHKVTDIMWDTIVRVRGKYTDVGLLLDQCGISWFLTREEAEKALEEGRI